MGYRSEIGLCLTADALRKFKQNMSAISSESEMNDLQYLLAYRNKIHKGRSAELWYWENIKWYPCFQEIRFIENLLTELDENDYLFIRIGESDDDVEIKGCYWDNPFGMYLSRVINFERASA